MKIKLCFVLSSLIILTSLCVVNIIKFNQVRLLHDQKIAEAQILIAEASNNKTDLKISSLKSAYAKMKETISVLESVPNTLGYSYNQAQDILLKIKPVFNQIENRLQTEEQAKANLESAQKLNTEVAKLTEYQTYSVESWQQAKEKKQQVIDLLNTIPPGTLLNTKITNELAASQLVYKEIINTIQKETIALKYLQSAKEIAQEAVSKTEDAVNSSNHPTDSMNNLSRLKSQWQLTLKLLSSVNPVTTSFEESQKLQTYYKANLQSVNDAQNQLKKCAPYDETLPHPYLCSDDVSLNITMPPINKETNSQESSSVISQDSYSSDKNEVRATERSQSPTKEEIEKALCNEIVKKYPSHPYYLDCKERGY